MNTLYVPDWRNYTCIDFTTPCGSTVTGLKFAINKDEFELAHRFEKNSWSRNGKIAVSTQPEEYVNGLKPFVVLQGKLAEIATGVLFTTPVDFEIRPLGDQSLDIALGGKKVDVKTKYQRFGPPDNHILFITHHDATGYQNKIDADYYISSLITYFSVEERKAEVLLLGYQPRAVIVEQPIRPSKRGGHYNLEWQATNVCQIIDLVELYCH